MYVDNMHQPSVVFLKTNFNSFRPNIQEIELVTNPLDFSKTSLWLLTHAILEMVWENSGPYSMMRHHQIQSSIVLN